MEPFVEAHRESICDVQAPEWMGSVVQGISCLRLMGFYFPNQIGCMFPPLQGLASEDLTPDPLGSPFSFCSNESKAQMHFLKSRPTFGCFKLLSSYPFEVFFF